MFCDVWLWAGEIRQTQLNLGRPVLQIQPDLYSLLQDLQSWADTKLNVLEQAVRLHHRAVAIHPFVNGNGRWSRLLSNIWLKRNGHPLVDWPEPACGEQSDIRDEYIQALQSADGGNITPLSQLHQRFLGQ